MFTTTQPSSLFGGLWSTTLQEEMVRNFPKSYLFIYSFSYHIHINSLLLSQSSLLSYIRIITAFFSAAQNSFVHVWMYLYYLLASLNIEVRYKKYITLMQMTQFLINLLQAIYDIVFTTPYPVALAKMLFFYMISLLALFANFYVKSGRQPRLAKGQEPQKKRE